MPRLLPVGAEFEVQYPASRNPSTPVAPVVRYRVKAHDEVEHRPGVRVYAERLEAVGTRYRRVTGMWTDEPDMFGEPVLRCTLNGDPPDPFYREELERAGVEVGTPAVNDA